MVKLYTSQDRVLIGHVRNVLEGHGIRSEVRNEFLAGASGEIPFIETWPEIWLIDAADLARARELLVQILKEVESPGPDWTCGHCGERIDGQFGACWNCGAERPPNQ